MNTEKQIIVGSNEWKITNQITKVLFKKENELQPSAFEQFRQIIGNINTSYDDFRAAVKVLLKSSPKCGLTPESLFKGYSVTAEKHEYIWTQKEIHPEVNFAAFYHQGKQYYGRYQPSNKETPRKDGSLKREQVHVPVLLNTSREHIRATPDKLFELGVSCSIPTRVRALSNTWNIEGMRDFVDGISPLGMKEIFNRLSSYYIYHIYYLDETWCQVETLWDMGTYFFELFPYYPIYEYTGIKWSGKTQRLKISTAVSFNSLGILQNPSESSLFRLSQATKGTRHIDEAEKLYQFDKHGNLLSDPRVELLNASFQRGASVPRQEFENKKYVTKWYDPYAPTVIASINGVRDALLSRSISEICHRGPSTDIRMKREPDPNDSRLMEIRNHLYANGLLIVKEVMTTYSTIRETVKGLSGRPLDIWLPVLTMAKLVSTELFEGILSFAINHETNRNEEIEADSRMGQVITKFYEKVRAAHDPDDGTRPTMILLSEIAKELGMENGSKYVGAILDKVGFAAYRTREGGTGLCAYRIPDKKFIDSIVGNLMPNYYASLSSPDSQNEGKDDLVSEEEVKNSEDNEDIVKKVEGIV